MDSSPQMSRLPELLPKPLRDPMAGGQLTLTRSLGARRRIAVAVACTACQLRKRKCDGGRPKCLSCSRLNMECDYDTEPGETRTIARNRRNDEMKRDLEDLQELYLFLRTRPEREVSDIIRHIRTNEDPIDVLRFIKDGDLLVEASLTSHTGVGKTGLQLLDEKAYRLSSIRVPARPWTVIASDGIVSELVSIFFTTEQPLLNNFLDKSRFLKDMRNRDSRTSFICSPFLVNTICAYSAFTSPSVMAADQLDRTNLRKKFHQEAKKQFDLETGRPSLATIAAAYITYFYCSAAGADRAGAIFRYTTCEMIKRMKLNSLTSVATDARWHMFEDRETVVSRLVWGLFCQECLTGYIYMQPPLIAMPKLPKTFQDSQGDGTEPPTSDHFLDSQCELFKHLNDIARYNYETKYELGEEEDLNQRTKLFNRLSLWMSPPLQEASDGFKQHSRYIFLKAFQANAIIAIFRPVSTLQGTIIFPQGIGPSNAVCVQQGNNIMDLLQTLEKSFPDQIASGFLGAIYLCYIVGISLVGNLEHEVSSIQPFTKACQYLYRWSYNWPVARALLTGIQAMAWQLKLMLPEESRQYFDPEHMSFQHVGDDIPINYVVPQHAEMAESLTHEAADSAVVGVELGRIIAKWSSMTL